MNGDSSKYFQLDQCRVDRKIIFKRYTPEPESKELAITQHGVLNPYEWEKPAAIHYDRDLTVKFENHGPEFRAKLDILKKQGIKRLYLEAAKKADLGEMKCISPRRCQICDKYKSELAGTQVGRPRKRKGGRKRLNQ